MRKLARSVARNNMKKKGYTKINQRKGAGSFFSEKWREFVRK